MTLRILPAAIAATVLFAPAAFADLEPWKDYVVSDSVWSVTAVKVKANLSDAYLEGIRDTWVKGNEVAKKLGQIKDYAIYRSDLPQSGDFNLMLVVEFEKGTDLEPNQARYEAFMAEWGKKNADAATEFAQRNYPAMREIVGEYRFRRIELK